jgi:serine/threonine protein kinase
MIDKTDRVMVTDFGIARVTDAATATMVGMGTPAYMAPEQARGLDPVPQTDIYAMGVVLFEMLTGGERPFTGEQARTTGSTSEKVRWEQMHLEPPSPRKYNPDIAPAVEAVVLKCLEKDPSNRYTRTLELVQALDMAITDSGELHPVGESLPFAARTIKTDAGIEDAVLLEPDAVSYPSQELAPPTPTKPSTSKKWASFIGVFGVLALIMASILFYMQRQPILSQPQTVEVAAYNGQSPEYSKPTDNIESVITKTPTKTRREPTKTKTPTNAEVRITATRPSTKTRLPPSPTKPPPKANTPIPSGPLFLELDQNYHCRGGPGADFELLRDFVSGSILEIIGKDISGSWLLIAINDPSTRKKLCWIHGGVVLGDPARLSTCSWYGDGYTDNHTCQGP